MKKAGYWTALLLIGYGLVELSSYTGLRVLSSARGLEYAPMDRLSGRHQAIIQRLLRDEHTYHTLSPTLGWTIKANGSSKLFRANSKGIRGDREYQLKAAKGVCRITTFGDSFTHSSEVRNSETWQAVMEARRDHLEVINFGVGGYGLDQAYLRYRELGSRYQADIVLIGFMSENLLRNVNRFRPFYHRTTRLPLAKPRFVVQGDRLVLLSNPLVGKEAYRDLLREPGRVLARVAKHDYYFHSDGYKAHALDWSPTVRLLTMIGYQLSAGKTGRERAIGNGKYDVGAKPFKVTTKIMDAFHARVAQSGAKPVIILFPTRWDLQDHRAGKGLRYAPLRDYLDSVGYRYVDLVGAFDGARIKRLFGRGHYSAEGYRRVAEYLLKELGDLAECGANRE